MVISGKTSVYAIIGSPVYHSLSPAMHNETYAHLGIDAVFVALPCKNAADAIRGAKALGIKGLAVTAPFKMDVLPFCDKLEPMAGKVGAVNTLLFGDVTEGFNTDIDGITLAFAQAGYSIQGKRLVIIGAGGAARGAIGSAIREGAASIQLIVRNAQKAKEDLHNIFDRISFPLTINSIESKQAKDAIIQSEIIINTAPGDHLPFDPALLIKGQVLLDAVYKPGGTQLIKEAAKAGCTAIAGQTMLLKQALRQFEIFTEQKAPENTMNSALVAAMQREGV